MNNVAKESKENPNFVDNWIKYELSSKQIEERINWLNCLTDEQWFTIGHIVNDLKDLKKNSMSEKQFKKEATKLKNENVWLSKEINCLNNKLNDQNQAIKVLTKHIEKITGEKLDDLGESSRRFLP